MNRSKSNKRKRLKKSEPLSNLLCIKCKSINLINFHSDDKHIEGSWWGLLWFEQGHTTIRRSSNKGFG